LGNNLFGDWRSEKICKQCGKLIIVRNPDEWAYRYKGKRLWYFCSWHCLRAFEKEKNEKGEK